MARLVPLAHRVNHSHSIINSFGKLLIGLMQTPQRLHAYRQNYRHFERDPLAQLSPSIAIYREQSARPQYSAVEVYRDLSRSIAPSHPIPLA
ncbi:MAG: hypothetical protein WBC37_01665 [Burkholderiaceae bacterium]